MYIYICPLEERSKVTVLIYICVCVCVYRIRNNDIKYTIIKYSPSNVIVPYDTVARTEERTQCKWNNFIINFSIYISFCKIRLIYCYCLNVGSTQCNNSHIYFIYLVKVVIAFFDMLNCVFCINIAINFIVNSGLPECMYMTDKEITCVGLCMAMALGIIC